MTIRGRIVMAPILLAHLFAVLFFTITAPAAGKDGNQIYAPLADCGDDRLQQALERAVSKRLGDVFSREVARGNAALTVVDVTDLRRPRLAGLNGDRMLYAASLPKLAILLGVFHLVDRGQLEYDAAVKQSLTQMIRYSSNPAATKMLNLVGFERLAALLRSDRYQLYAQRYGGGLWVGRDYSGGQLWQRDPLHNVSHGATTFQTARFYYLLLTERLVSASLTEDMLQILSDPAIEHKFVKGLNDATGVDIYRKSGTWRQYHADSGIIVHGDYTYIAVALVKAPRGGSQMTRLIDVIDDVVSEFHR